MSLCYAEKYKNALFSELKMRVRTNPIPLDPSAIFDTYLEMEEYLAGPTSYAGQVIAVANGSIDISQCFCLKNIYTIYCLDRFIGSNDI